MSKKYTKEEINQKLYDKYNGEIKLIGDYFGMNEKTLFEHNSDYCHNIWETTPNYLIHRNMGCINCMGLRLRGYFALTYEQVKQYIESFGYKLLSKEYINAQTKLQIQCPEGHIYEVTFNNFQQGHRCNLCQNEIKNKFRIIPIENILKMLKEDELELVEWVTEYAGNKSLFIHKCKYGHISNPRPVQSYKVNRGCPECSFLASYEARRGENACNWQGGKTETIMYLRGHLTQWKKDSMRNCGYKCAITDKRFDVIHHVYGFDLILQEMINKYNLVLKPRVSDYTNKELNFLKSEIIRLHYKYPLGICLTKEIHSLFHDIYGYGKNTPEQFEEFTQRYYNSEFDSLLNNVF